MTVGQAIQRVREARGLSIPQVAATTRILAATVRAIEADDYSALPAPVYVRGFVRSIGTTLGMDTSQLLLAFDRQVQMPGPGEDDSQPLAPGYGDEESAEWMPLDRGSRFSLAIGLGIAALLGVFLYVGTVSEQPTQAAASKSEGIDASTADVVGE